VGCQGDPYQKWENSRWWRWSIVAERIMPKVGGYEAGFPNWN
jgi:hypothetical protein